MTKKQLFAQAMLQEATNLLRAYQALCALREEWAKLGYGQGAPNEIQDGDLTAINELSAADLAAGMETLGAIRVLLDAGHRATLYRLFRRDTR